MGKEKVIKVLGELGFIPEELDGIGMTIECEGLTILISEDNYQDLNCITLLAINLLDFEEDKKTEVYSALIELCSKIKFVQPQVMFGSQVWLCYQHYINNEDGMTAELMEHMIMVLVSSALNFNHILNESDYGK